MEKKIIKTIHFELHPLEAELITVLRERYKFGEIQIVMHQGLPRDIIQIINKHRLGMDQIGVIHKGLDLLN